MSLATLASSSPSDITAHAGIEPPSFPSALCICRMYPFSHASLRMYIIVFLLCSFVREDAEAIGMIGVSSEITIGPWGAVSKAELNT